MALRIGIDMDGTLADLGAAYVDLRRTLLGNCGSMRPPASDDGEPAHDEAEAASAEEPAAERRVIWDAIRQTPDFWLGLRPIEPGVVARLQAAMVTHGWEVFFLTQRPATAGQTVQQQTQQWLQREGFSVPSVLTLAGSRGRAAAALELDVLLDDLPKNCVDVLSESDCRPILIQRDPSALVEGAARHLRIDVVRSVADALPLLETTPRSGFFGQMFQAEARK